MFSQFLVPLPLREYSENRFPSSSCLHSGFQGSSHLHASDVLFGKFALSALAAEPFHRLCFFVIAFAASAS